MSKFLSAAFLLLSFIGLSQPYGNEWIDYAADRSYLKFYAGEEGIYRLDYATLNFELQEIGKTIGSVDPRSIQVFSKGAEQFIHVQGANDGSFDPGDFIEFYAEPNDGWLDESFYPANKHTNPYYSLYSDSLAYFITWHTDGTQSNFRLQQVSYNSPVSSTVNYLLEERLKVYNSTYQQGQELGSGKSYTAYTGGKGWMSGEVGYNGGQGTDQETFSVNLPQVYTQGGAPNAKLEFAVAGVNLGANNSSGSDHHAQIRITPPGSSAIVLKDLLFESYAYVRDEVTFPSTQLSGGNAILGLYVGSSFSQLNTTSDYSAIAYQKLTYPHTLNLEGKSSYRFKIPQSSSIRHFNASNFSTSSTSFLYDLEAHKRYEVDHNTVSGSLKTNIESGNERWMYVCTNAEIKNLSTSDLEAVNSTGSFTDPDSWYADSAYIMISHPRIWSQAQAYRNHRALTQNVRLIDITELYDQFAYGILRHPKSIRGFCDFAIDQWQSSPEYLFLVGKSLGESEFRKATSSYSDILVPTMGYPATDNLITAGLNGNPSQSALATGRLAASTNAQVSDYLAKVKEMELAQSPNSVSYNIPNRAWQKRILHFAGGNDAAENQNFRGYLGKYEDQVTRPNFGAEVALFSKTSSQVIQQLNTDTLRQLIKDGAAIMTFFGHASNNSFDISVDDPSLWDNQGRYPFVLANSCYSGNIHKIVTSVGSVSEEYVLIPREGAIAFIATPDLSFEGSLDRYTNELYFQFSQEQYGASIGKQMQQTALNVYTSDTSNTGLSYVSVALEMTLHGDPAMRIYPHDKAELVVNDYILGPQISFSPEILTTEVDSFDVLLDLTNLGRGTSDSFSVVIERILPSGETDRQATVLNGLEFEETIAFRFPTDRENGIGSNSFNVEVDFPNGVIDEFDPTNNNIINGFSTEILSAEIFPVYPYDFSVVPDLDVTLKANTGSPFIPSADYTFQIDTNDAYNSGFMRSANINQQGAVIEWKPGLDALGFTDSTVFFWRVSRKDSNEWREFSFQYIPNQDGWGQDHFAQYKNNRFDFLEADKNDRLFKLGQGERELTAIVIGNSSVSNVLERDRNEYRLDGNLAPFGEYGIASAGPGMAIVVIDTADLLPWGTFGYNSRTGLLENQDKDFGNNNNSPSNHRTRVEYFYTYRMDVDAQRNAMINLISNEVPDGFYILAYSQIHAGFDDYWTASDFAAFEALGADSISFVENNHPYLFLVKKGRPATAVEKVGKDPREVITIREILSTTIFSGTMESEEIGPAKEWKSLIWKHQSLEQPSSDVDSVWVIGLQDDNTEEVLLAVTTTGATDLSSINVKLYPKLKLRFKTVDEANRTSSQLKNWHVLFDPVPEAAINPAMGYVEPDGKVNAGSELAFGISLDNISDFDFDTMAVDYWIQDAGGNIVANRKEWLSGPKANTSTLDTISFSSRGLSGSYSFWMQANPMDENWQPEQYDFNNTAFRNFSVTPDNTNPLLDVTFDGVHIIDGDIVAPQPEIVVELNDENELLLLDDTSYVSLFLTEPSGKELRLPYFRGGRETLYFEPASGSKNKARITYSPEAALSDGEYTLRVSGTDASGNAAGKTEYAIRFEVINRSMITNVMNYPNPFSTSTRFVFTLTGAKVPDVFTIQIMTVTGKVVREITRDELGPIRIGRNITEYAWDGRDEFGDRMGNGVYLYRVITKISGESIESMQTSADNYFKEGFGKMYMFR